MAECRQNQEIRGYRHPENDLEEIRIDYGLEAMVRLELVRQDSQTPHVHLLKYALALANRESLEGMPLPHEGLINIPFTIYKICLVHIAAIFRNPEALLLLLRNGGDVNARDKRLWTCLHHAALCGDQGMVELLLANGANPDLKDDTERAYLDIIRLINYLPKPGSEVLPLFYSDVSTSEHQLTAGEYAKLTHSEYLDDNIITRKRMLKFWKEGLATVYNPKLNELFRERYFTFKKVRPCHLLSPVKKDSSQQPLFFSPGLGLFSRKVFEPQDVLGEYQGLYAVGFEGDLQYGVNEGPNACNYSNEMSRINDGFPNVSLIRLPNLNGMPFRRIFIALERIEPGQQIIWNYGTHGVKIGPYVELRPQELRAFLKSREFVAKMDILTHDFKSAPDVYEYYPLAEKIRYVLQTPPVLFVLIFEGFIKAHELRDIVKIGFKIKLLPQQWEMMMTTLTILAEEAAALRGRLNFISERTASDLGRYLACLTQSVTFPDVLAATRGIISRFNDYLFHSLDELRILGPELSSERIQYAWKEIHQLTESGLKNN